MKLQKQNPDLHYKQIETYVIHGKVDESKGYEKFSFFSQVQVRDHSVFFLAFLWRQVSPPLNLHNKI